MPEVALLTQVKRGSEQELRDYLRALQAQDPMPFANLGTHFARFVVIDVDGPHLLFTSRFDGKEAEYLTALAAVGAATEIWGHCVEPDPLDRDSLCKYLLKDRAARVPASYVVSALNEQETVERINAALALRDELSDFAATAEGLDAIDLAHAFRELTPVRRIAEP